MGTPQEFHLRGESIPASMVFAAALPRARRDYRQFRYLLVIPFFFWTAVDVLGMITTLFFSTESLLLNRADEVNRVASFQALRITRAAHTRELFREDHDTTL